MSFADFFRRVTGSSGPHSWQQELGAEGECTNRLIRIPTGFGKTLGVLIAWLWNRVECDNDEWPRRLVWCLPMRVLVEQTEQEVRKILAVTEQLWNGDSHQGKVGVHVLMGGTDSGDWHRYPEECAVLIGTQDMLLSRAMNRGYAASRARWPMEFGLLNQDCLWIMDEVQLMDVGFATSMQLQAFRDEDAGKGCAVRACRTWWMSATLQHNWMRYSPDTIAMADNIACNRISAPDRIGHLWEDVKKICCIEKVSNEKGLAKLVVERCASPDHSVQGLVLVVVNTVNKALQVYDILTQDKKLKSEEVDLRLVHSRFRPAERFTWRTDFLCRDACAPHVKRIIVTTQVVEAGVDVSAVLLITELAPWPSLVQRFGRCARWGGEADVIVADFMPKDDKAAAPYAKEEIDASREALQDITDVAPLHLEAFEDSHPELLSRLYPYAPSHLLLRHEINELFDTTVDLSGADIDISRFIRSDDERDVRVFWANVEKNQLPPENISPTRDALCAVPFLQARDWLCGNETKSNKKPRLKDSMRAWVWDWLNGSWKVAERRDLFPGQTILVATDCGGYDTNRGWSPESRTPVIVIAGPDPLAEDTADSSQESEALSMLQWQTITFHCRETGQIAKQLAKRLAPAYSHIFSLTGRLHDLGKAHEAFQASIKDKKDSLQTVLLAKAPFPHWKRGKDLYRMSSGERRAGFRHELVSVLALLALLQRCNPDHSALLGPWRELLEAAGFQPLARLTETTQGNTLEEEVLNLNSDAFNLLAYLVCTHHGKVRLAWHAGPADQGANDQQLRIMGVKNGDSIPPVSLVDEDGVIQALPEFVADLSPAAVGLNPKTGTGWTERVLRLLEVHGPFTLAWMEAVFRAADHRASSQTLKDDLLYLEETP